ncbi:MAG: Asp-tRNA(Asn)/Glu-tRNA(Gln) amidotransferase subunit GatB [Salibacteraceae bacterium]
MANSVDLSKYEVVVGLEVHAQLTTKSKAFSSDRNEYGNLPNTNTNPVSLGHPGTLPVLNEKCVEYAVKLGLAVGANIRHHNEFARKNYFYADLPKGYQITQDTTPVCNGGHIKIKLADGTQKTIGITRIHMEEDSGKSIHDLSPFETMIDLNRAGVPLLEIVSEPDMRSGDEAYAYLTQIRQLVRYLEICDGNMEEGSLRCDANISVRRKGDKQFGTRVEVKNLNSIRNVKRAIDYEFQRQVSLIEAGEQIQKSTLNFNATTGTTSVMRVKEEADDYRYFPEPDLPPLVITDEFIHRVKADMPSLPDQLYNRFVEAGLSEYDATVLTDEKGVALYFEELMEYVKHPKSAANWLMGEVKSYLNELAIDIGEFPLPPGKLAELVNYVDEGNIGRTLASQQLFPLLLKNPQSSPAELASQHGLVQVDDADSLQGFIQAALEKYPEKVAEYRAGKKGILGLFMGEVMRMSQGKADPKKTNQLLQKLLEE